MRTILGLDLGVASIGWAIVSEDDKRQELLKAGVRVIPLDSTTVSDYSKGASTSKTQDRRVKRGIRRNMHRYKLRKHLLNEFLKKNNIEIPAELFKLSSVELYGLRHKALSEKVTLPELARMWYHLNQKRGYINSRKGISEDEKDTQYVEKIKASSNFLIKEDLTVGSYFYHKLLENPIYRIKSGNDKEQIFLVSDYQYEFQKIWDKQKEYYPEFLTDENYDEVFKRIIYYKRKLKSQKILISKCRYEHYHKCMPITSPVNEEIRLWQDINKLKITSKTYVTTLPTLAQKRELFDFLMTHERISEEDILGLWKYATTKNEYKLNIDKSAKSTQYLKGYAFRTKLFNLLDAHKVDKSKYLHFDATNDKFSEHPYYQIWHLLYATEEVDNLKQLLIEKYGFNAELSESIMKLSIKNDFASLSSRAGRKLLPYLREGQMYHEACASAGYNHSDSETAEERDSKELLPVADLPHIKPNQLKNPTVEKILNQLINLLKALDTDGYKFDEIRIELARDLKKSAKDRQYLTERNRDTEKDHRAIFDAIKELIPKPSKRDIEKYKLWREFDGCSPYEPNVRIELQDLFDRNKYQVEHIIPKSRLFDDSFANKTIARSQVNSEKDQQTAYDYMSKKGELLHQYIECIKYNKKLSKSKREYLQLQGKDIPSDFVTRQLNDTRYIAKETTKILRAVCRNVTSTTGIVTDYLRHHWGYDRVLMDLNFERVAPEEIVMKEINDKQEKVIKDWSKRLDHRHHAVDAIVIACTKQSYIQQLNTLNAIYEGVTDAKELSIKTRVPFSYEAVKNTIASILVSFKAGKRVATRKTVRKDRWGVEPGNINQVMLVPRGALHEDSIYGNNLTYKKIKIKDLKDTAQCAVVWQRELIEQHLAAHKIELKDALKDLKKRPIFQSDKTPLEEVTIYRALHVKRYGLEYTATNKFDMKAAQSIVNKNVREIVIKRLRAYNEDPSLAFKDLKQNPIYFNEAKGIEIKSVRCYTGGAGYPALHESINGKTYTERQTKGMKGLNPVDFIITGNNHHLAIYETQEGELNCECITLMEAVERKRNNQEVIDKNHPMGYKFIQSIQLNEMFIVGLSKEDTAKAIENGDLVALSKHLYRVQKFSLSSGFDLKFRHHLETILDDSKSAKEVNKFYRVSTLKNLSRVKVKISITNKISLNHD